METDLPRMLTKRELCQLVPYTPQHILRLEKKGMFPKRKQIGLRRVGWWLHEVMEWLEKRPDLKCQAPSRNLSEKKVSCQSSSHS